MLKHSVKSKLDDPDGSDKIQTQKTTPVSETLTSALTVNPAMSKVFLSASEMMQTISHLQNYNNRMNFVARAFSQHYDDITSMNSKILTPLQNYNNRMNSVARAFSQYHDAIASVNSMASAFSQYHNDIANMNSKILTPLQNYNNRMNSVARAFLQYYDDIASMNSKILTPFDSFSSVFSEIGKMTSNAYAFNQFPFELQQLTDAIIVMSTHIPSNEADYFNDPSIDFHKKTNKIKSNDLNSLNVNSFIYIIKTHLPKNITKPFLERCLLAIDCMPLSIFNQDVEQFLEILKCIVTAILLALSFILYEDKK